MGKHERFLDKESAPTQGAVNAALGAKALKAWRSIVSYLDEAYGIEPALEFGGRSYGWCFRYRKGGRTLCTLYPEKGSFTVLVVLGGKDLEKLKPDLATLSKSLQDLIENTHRYPEGKWCWIRMPGAAKLNDLKRLFALKRKPRAR